jgi:oligopeptide/dipeptide ABC transporter ATP-binding protein
LFRNPLHPYTHALLSGIPVPDVTYKTRRIVLTGDVPSPLNPPMACRFHTRCPFVIDVCRQTEPVVVEPANGHKVACHRHTEVEKLISEKFGGM